MVFLGVASVFLVAIAADLAMGARKSRSPYPKHAHGYSQIKASR